MVLCNVLLSLHALISKYQNLLSLLKLGFHTCIHQNKDKMSDPKLASKFYLVTNKFEHG